MSLDWKTLYENGATVEDLALEFQVTTVKVRKELAAQGTEMRRPGQRSGVPQQNNTRVEASKPSGRSGIHVAFAGARGIHRRRGRKRAA